LNGVGEEYLTHPYFEVWQDFILRWYKPVQGKIPLFLPCSNKKPYGESETHKRIIGMLESTSSRKLFHELMLSNPGVIPREFEDKYPFNNYDWDERLETEEIKKRYTEVTEQRIERYLKAHEEYIKKACCYLKPDSESYIALEEACKSLEIPLFNLLSREAYEKIKEEKKVLQTTEALKSLEEGLKCLQQDSTS
jgi:predicted RNA-binding protein